MTRISFTKLQGIGNDYFFIEDFDEKISSYVSSLSQKMSHRYFGVGSDGIILLQRPSSQSSSAHLRMRMFNADGSEAEMCGNGVRGFAKYCFDRNLKQKLVPNRGDEEEDRHVLWVETFAGLIKTQVVKTSEDGLKAEMIRVDMGEPQLIKNDKEVIFNEDLEIDNECHKITRVSMGNPHCVLFVNNFDFNYRELGAKIETNPLFPKKTNVEFIQLVNPREVNFRVWERGSGETLACGTGACASVVASVLNQKTERQVTVHLKAGDLEIEWNEKDNHIYMTGPSVEVFTGEYVYDHQ